MINRDIEMVFPPRIIPSLRDVRGEVWENLIDQIVQKTDSGIDRIAFVLIMVRLAGCLSCQADSFRAMRGCFYCSSQTIKRFRGSDQDLQNMFILARDEVKGYISKDW
jgi:hypothetical protein